MRVLAQLVFAVVLVSLASAAAQALGLERTRWDALLTLAIFLGMRAPSVTGGALVAAAAGYLQDLYAGIPWGLSSSVYVLVFAGTRLMTQALHGEGWLFAALLSFLGSLAGGLVSTLLYGFFSPAGAGLPAWSAIVPTALLTAALSPVVFGSLGVIDRLGRPAEAGLGLE